MTYFSPEIRLLKLLAKVYNRVPGIYERFVTDDIFDTEKAKAIFADRGIPKTRLQTAVQALTSAGFANALGITELGLQKLASIETERINEINRLALTSFFDGTTGHFDQVAMDTLNAKEY